MSDRILILVALSLIIAMVAGTAIQIRRPQPTPILVKESMRRPDYAIPLDNPMTTDMAGVTKPFHERLTRPTVVNFWASWCIPCVRELPLFAKFKPLAEAVGIQVLTINVDKEGAPVAKKFLEERGIADMPVILDPDGSVSKSLQVRGMPTALLVNVKGEETARMEGEADWSGPGVVELVVDLLTLPSLPVPAR
ncbi:Thiol:disulfide oxidoreductase TlpA [Paramagnetospirillum magnetotacticum MS-1]|uniref:Thiol:disulfide oxidoreductase TlpA n=1 Tax=Paramagnetospirillum magnetotacticum MS-1 TaxID=272627 RepID=A0A0C2U9Y9_PARME|nr:TlpA disulfide reductase family protein [Paramagnetospirillum magnetotacticum]KIL98302.1 Thiol:disulfide oxidoreductase TlpA [Paramagnetospirillum magnetotacticum MS-1]